MLEFTKKGNELNRSLQPDGFYFNSGKKSASSTCAVSAASDP